MQKTQQIVSQGRKDTEGFLLIFKSVRVPTCRFTGIDRTSCAMCRSPTVQQILFYRGHDLSI